MESNPYILDTSALLAFIEQEDGAERVQEILQNQPVILSWLSILEVVYITRRELGEEESLTRYALLRQLKSKIIWNTDESLLLTAAKLKASYRLSMADAVIAAIAIQHKATLVHKDPEYEQIQNEPTMESLPYKRKFTA